MRRRLLVLSLLVVGLVLAGTRARGRAQSGAGDGHLAWSYDVVSHLDAVTVGAGCAPAIRFLGFDLDAQGQPAAAWQQSGCGLPTIGGDETGIRVARRLNGAWSVAAMNDALCGDGNCRDVRGRPAMALRADGHPFVLYSAQGYEYGHGLRMLDVANPGVAPLLEFLAPANDLNANVFVAAGFARDAAPGDLPDRVRATGTYGGDVYLNGASIGGVQGLSWIDYAAGPGGSRHVALHSTLPGIGGGVVYSGGGAPTLALPTVGNYGGSIAVAPGGRRHIANAGGPAGSPYALMHAWSDDGVTWQSEVVDPGVTQQAAIAVDPDGLPAIAYWVDGKDLWLARRDAAGVWRRTLVATTAGAHQDVNPQLAFDAGGRPYVAYYSHTSQDVIVARGEIVPSSAAARIVVSKAGTGTGTVTSAPGGVACGDDCEESYVPGTTVVLTAAPDSGYVFGGWTGACTDTGPCIVAVNGVTTAGAIFHRPKPGATIVVTSTAQSPGAAGDCTLGEAIEAANADAAVDGCAAGSGADTIVVPAGAYVLNEPADIAPREGDSGLPVVTTEITIAGDGAASTIVERAESAPNFRFLRTTPNSSARLTLRGVTLRGGRLGANYYGGSVYLGSGGTVIDGVTIDGSFAGESGGAIYSNSPIAVARSTFSANHATNGGALYLGPATIEHSTFAGNTAGQGGAVRINSGVVANSTFTGNSSTSDGGALRGGGGPIAAVRLTMSGNSAGAGGGAIFPGDGSFTLIDSFLSANRSSAGGGAIATQASSGPSLIVSGTTFANNTTSGSGGAMTVYSAVAIANSTFSGNHANDSGGALDIGRPMDMRNVTLTGNDAGHIGGGLRYTPYSQPVTLANTIVAGNTAAHGYPDCYAEAALVSLGHNIVGMDWGCPIAAADGDRIGTYEAPIDPRLGPLADNGGVAPTHEPARTSPAVDHGSPDAPGSGPAACELVDQRGVARPQRAACDIGAVERANRLPVVSAGGAFTTPEDQSIDVTIAATDEEHDAVTFAVGEPPQHGTLSGQFPTLTYAPAHNFFGVDTFSIVASDPYGSASPVVFTVTVTPINDRPAASDDDVSVLANGGAQTIHVLDNDTTFPDEGETLTVASVFPAAHGAVAIAAGGSAVTYTPDAHYAGPDFFVYTISDGGDEPGAAFVHVTVQPTADLRIVVAASQDTVHAGERFTYTAAVSNPGPGVATDVSAAVILPSDVTVHGTAGCTGSVPGPVLTTVTMAAPQLAAGASITCEMTVSTIPAGTVSVSASIRSSTGDPDPNTVNNSMTVFTTNAGPLAIEVAEAIGVSDEAAATPSIMIDVMETIGVNDDSEPTPLGPRADLRLTLQDVQPVEPVIGQDFTIRYNILNAGPDAATPWSELDVPSAVTFVADGPGGSCNWVTGAPAGTRRLRCTHSDIPAPTGSTMRGVIPALTFRTDTAGTYLFIIRVGSSTADPDPTNNTVTRTVTVVNTAIGTNVVVTPSDPATGTTPASVTFGSVNQSGTTSVSSAATGPAAPAGFKAGSPATYYDISTTAGYSGAITVCIGYTGVSFAPSNAPRLFHYEGSSWVDRTISVDSASSTVCASVSSLSPFAIFTRGDVTMPGDMRGDGFIRQSGAKYQFDFRVRERPTDGERGRLRLDIKYDAKKVKDDVFVARAVTAVAFSDDPTVRPGHAAKPLVDTVVFSGTGDWNGAPNYRFELRAADEGEPGRHRESVSITIVDPAGRTVAAVAGTLTGGNVQSVRVHR